MTLSSSVQPFSRRGICPALSAPMQTGDGLLSRIAFTAGFSAKDLAHLCDLAIRHGNGLVDITARGSFQFRGLSAESALALERDVLALDLALRQGVAIETSPLASLEQEEICDPSPIVEQIRDRSTALGLHERLAAKMSVIVDGGGRVPMGGLVADIRLKAIERDDVKLWQLMLGGGEDKAVYAGSLLEEEAAGCVVDLLCCLAAKGADARGRDMDLATVRNVCGPRLFDIADPGKTSVGSFSYPAERRQLWPLKDGHFAAVIAPAFGQVAAERLSRLCRHAAELGVLWVRTGPGHALYIVASQSVCETLLDHAERAGFIVRAGDPRSSIAACAGAPACASAISAVQDLASFAAKECAGMLDGSFTLHLSGCGKGCAHPGAALLAFFGTSAGLAFAYSAKVSATADSILPLWEQKAALSRLARLYEKEHKPGENARAVFARLGRVKVAEALRQHER